MFSFAPPSGPPPGVMAKRAPTQIARPRMRRKRLIVPQIRLETFDASTTRCLLYVTYLTFALSLACTVVLRLGYDRKALSVDNGSLCNSTIPLWPNNDNATASSSTDGNAFVLGCTAPLYPGQPISNGSLWTGLIGGLSRYDGSLSLSVSFPGDTGIQPIVDIVTYDVSLEGLGNAAAASSTKAPPPSDWIPVAALANATVTMRCNTDYPTNNPAAPVSCAGAQFYDSAWTSFGQGGGGGYGLYRFTVVLQDTALSNYATNSTFSISYQVAAFRASEIAVRITLMVVTFIAACVWLRNMLWRRTRSVAIDKTTGSPVIVVTRVWTAPWQWLPQQKWVGFLFFVLLLWLNPLYVAAQLMLPTSSSSPSESPSGGNNDGYQLAGPNSNKKHDIPSSSVTGGAGVPWQLFLSAAILEVSGWAAIFAFFWILIDGMKVSKAEIVALAGRHAFTGVDGPTTGLSPLSATGSNNDSNGGGRTVRTATIGGRASFVVKGGNTTLQVGSSLTSLPPSTLARKATAAGANALATSAASSAPPQMAHLGYGTPGEAVAAATSLEDGATGTSVAGASSTAASSSSSSSGSAGPGSALSPTANFADALLVPDENDSVHKRAAAAMLLALAGDATDTTGTATTAGSDAAWAIPGLSHEGATATDYRSRLGSADISSTAMTSTTTNTNTTATASRPLLPPVVRLGEYTVPSHFLLSAFGFFLDANDDDEEGEVEGMAVDAGRRDSRATGGSPAAIPAASSAGTSVAPLSINVVVSDNGIKASAVPAPPASPAPLSVAAPHTRKRSSTVAGNGNGGNGGNSARNATRAAALNQKQGCCSWLCCGCACCLRSSCCQSFRSLLCGEVVVHSKASPLFGVRAYPTAEMGWAFYWPKVLFFVLLTLVGSALEALSQPDQLFGGRTSSTNPLSTPGGAKKLFTAVVILGGLYLTIVWAWFLLFLWSSITTGRQLEKLPYVATRYQQLSYRFFLFQQLLVVIFVLVADLYPIFVFLADIRAHPLVTGSAADPNNDGFSSSLSRLQQLKRQSLFMRLGATPDDPNTSNGGVALSVETQVAAIIRSLTEAVTPIGELLILSVSVWILAYFYGPPPHALPPGLVGKSVEGAEATGSEVSGLNRSTLSLLDDSSNNSSRPVSGAISRGKNVAFVEESSAETAGANAASTSLAIRHGLTGGYQSGPVSSAASSTLSSPNPSRYLGGGGTMELSESGLATPRSAVSSYSTGRGLSTTSMGARPQLQQQANRQSVSLRSMANAVVSAPIAGVTMAGKAANALRTAIEETLLGLPPDAAEHRFSTATASVLFDFAEAVYFDPPAAKDCGLSERTASSYGVLPAAPHGFGVEGVAYDRKTDTFCVVWRQFHRIIIAFRGTVTRENVTTDLAFRPEAVEFGVDTDTLGQSIGGTVLHPPVAQSVQSVTSSKRATASASSAPKTPEPKSGKPYASRALRAQIAASRTPQGAGASSSGAGGEDLEMASAYEPLEASAVNLEAAASHKSSSAASHLPVVRLALPLVHSGFWKAYSSVRPQLKAIVRSSLVAAFTETGQGRLYLTGHSLGGSLASLAAFDLHPMVDEVRKSLMALDPSIAMAINRAAAEGEATPYARADAMTGFPTTASRSWGAGHPLPGAGAGAGAVGASTSRPPVFSASAAMPAARGAFSTTAASTAPGPSTATTSAPARRPSASLNSASALGPYARFLLSQQQEQLERQQSSSALGSPVAAGGSGPSSTNGGLPSPGLQRSISSTSTFLDPAAAAAETALQLARKQEDDEDEDEELSGQQLPRNKRTGAPMSASKLNRGSSAAATATGAHSSSGGGYGALSSSSADRLDAPLLADGDEATGSRGGKRSRTATGPLGAAAAARLAAGLLGKRKRTGSGAALRPSSAGDEANAEGDDQQQEDDRDDEDRLAIEVLLDADILEGEDPLDCVGLPPSQDEWFDSELYSSSSNSSIEDKNKDVVLCSFGAPRVGNALFARAFNARIPWAWRIVFDGDVITSVPPKVVIAGCGLAFYKHLGNEVWVDGNGNCIVDPSFVERSFRVKSKTSFRAHRMASYRRALISLRRNEGMPQYREWALSRLLPPSTWAALLVLAKTMRNGTEGDESAEDEA